MKIIQTNVLCECGKHSRTCKLDFFAAFEITTAKNVSKMSVVVANVGKHLQL